MAPTNGTVQQGNGIAKGAAAKRELAQKLIAKPKTGGYRPSLMTMGGMLGTGGFGAFGGFTLWQIEQMRDDPKVSIGLEFKNAPIYNAEFEISGHAEQCAYVAAMLKRFWQKSLNVALDADAYGYVGSEACFKREGGAIVFDRLKPLHPLDVLPWTKEGQLTQVQVSGYGNNNAWVQNRDPDDGSGLVFLPGAQTAYPGKGFWYAHNAKYHPWFGRSALRSSWLPWRMKNLPGHGAIEAAFLWAYKHGISPLIMGHPVGETYQDDNGTEIQSQDLARQIGEMLKSGAVVAKPTNNYPAEAGGGPKWTIDFAQVQPGGEHLIAWIDALDKAILTGLLIPDEIISHDGNTGGYSRSQVSLHAFFLMAERNLNFLLEAADEQLLKPLVTMQWGRADYKIKPQPLIKEDQGQGNQSQGTEAQKPPGMPGQAGPQAAPGAAPAAAPPGQGQANTQDPFAALMGGGPKAAMSMRVRPHCGQVVVLSHSVEDEPRDESGKWVAEGGKESEPTTAPTLKEILAKIPRLTRIGGRRVEARSISKMPDGRLVLLHASRAWGKNQWTADGESWAGTKREAFDLAQHLEIVSPDGSTRFEEHSVDQVSGRLHSHDQDQPPTQQGNLFTDLKDSVARQREMFPDANAPLPLPEEPPRNRPDLPGQRTLFSQRRTAQLEEEHMDTAAEFYRSLRDKLRRMREPEPEKPEPKVAMSRTVQMNLAKRVQMSILAKRFQEVKSA